jgi:hypothetical protein
MLRESCRAGPLHRGIEITPAQTGHAEAPFLGGQVERPLRGFVVRLETFSADVIEAPRRRDAVGHEREPERTRVVLRQIVNARNRFGARFRVQPGREVLAQCAHAPARMALRFENGDGMTEILELVRRAQTRKPRTQDEDTLGGPAPLQTVELRGRRKCRGDQRQEFTAGVHRGSHNSCS